MLASVSESMGKKKPLTHMNYRKDTGLVASVDLSDLSEKKGYGRNDDLKISTLRDYGIHNLWIGEKKGFL